MTDNRFPAVKYCVDAVCNQARVGTRLARQLFNIVAGEQTGNRLAANHVGASTDISPGIQQEFRRGITILLVQYQVALKPTFHPVDLGTRFNDHRSSLTVHESHIILGRNRCSI